MGFQKQVDQLVIKISNRVKVKLEFKKSIGINLLSSYEFGTFYLLGE